MMTMNGQWDLIENGVGVEKPRCEAGISLRSRFSLDTIFGSPGTAAAMVRANNTNGWTEWKYGDGRTLDEVKRQGG